MRKVILLTVAFILLGAVIAYSAPGDTLWTRTYGGTSADYASSFQQTTDGGYIIAGYTSSFGAGADDFYVIKTDALGDTLWTQTYGGASIDVANCVQQTTDGGYIVAGWTASFGAGTEDFYLIKTDASGDTLWTRTYGGTSADYASYVQQTTDGGYIVAGQTGSFGAGGTDFYMIKTDASGATLWTRTYGGTSHDYGYSVQQTTDGGYIIAGYTASFSASTDFYLIKTDSLGDTLWTGTYGGDSLDQAYSVQQTSDEGYIITGRTESYGAGSSDFYLIKTDTFGDTMWTRTYGGLANEEAISVQQTADSGYILAGQTNSFGAGSWDFYLVKTYPSGDILWTRTYGGTDDDRAHSVQQTTDEGYIITGRTGSYGAGSQDFYLIKVEGDPCLTCNAISQSNRVPNVDGIIIWDLEVQNCGVSNPVYAEIYPTVGDCTSGTQYDFNINRLAVSNLGAGDSTTLYYWYRPGTVVGVIDAAINIDVGPAIDNYISNCCFEFIFAYEFGRPGTVINFGPGEWGELGDEIVVPTTTALMQNYPNPFNATTTISFDIVQTDDVNLSVYNLAGQKIETLVENRLNAGQHHITWDASTYSSGVYFYKLTTGDKTFTKRMTLMK
ncbi:MAG: T9SS type A sorting domain-containing protein [bacterium]|nr:T9SS type A sorting domain-containing protein [bacterium]